MELFISYAREDEAYRKELAKHLSALLRQKVITDWHDRKIVAGQDWGREISTHLHAASVILLLVSPDFMDSDYCWDVEMVHAIAMEKRGGAVVIPVIIRPVDFEGAPFSHLQALPTDARPVSRWDDHDEAWVDVVKGIRAAIARFRAPAAQASDSTGSRRDRPPSRGAGPMLDWLGEDGEQLRSAFIQVFGEHVRPFGSRAMQRGGLSDGNQGVQWNAAYELREGTRWVGVNLEGVQYRDWPIARLIERELRSPTLPGLVRSLGATDPVAVWWTRDYWQAASRPPIEERTIPPSPIFIRDLTEARWAEALQGAAGCLASPRGGRALQEVILARSGRRLTGEVSPHLKIALSSNTTVPWLDFLSEGRMQLQPFYDWAVEQAK